MFSQRYFKPLVDYHDPRLGVDHAAVLAHRGVVSRGLRFEQRVCAQTSAYGDLGLHGVRDEIPRANPVQLISSHKLAKHLGGNLGCGMLGDAVVGQSEIEYNAPADWIVLAIPVHTASDLDRGGDGETFSEATAKGEIDASLNAACGDERPI